ncbi:MAG TPA: DUF1444 family protein [Tepidisphaeraceae bacterium]|nr:DUF1444 family protein [Tepidisphaeraceae bacterium]
MSELSREQFVAELLEHVKVKFPLVKIAEGEQPFSLRVNGQLAGLENIYRMVILRPQERLHHIDRWIVELLRAAEGTPDRTGKFDDVKDRILPMVLPGVAAESYKGTVTSSLVDGLVVAYAIDQDRTISYIPRERFEHWNISEEDLHELAINNLVTRSETLAAHAAEDDDGEVNLILFQTMDGYDASRVLLPTLHERLRPYLGSPFGAAIPNRDILLCFRNDAETVARLKAQVVEDYRQMPHQVTDQLLLITPDGIAVRE